jgi:hypothetical protein
VSVLAGQTMVAISRWSSGSNPTDSSFTSDILFGCGLVLSVMGGVGAIAVTPGLRATQEELAQANATIENLRSPLVRILRAEMCVLSEILQFGECERVSLYFDIKPDGGRDEYPKFVALVRFSRTPEFEAAERIENVEPGIRLPIEKILRDAWFEHNGSLFVIGIPEAPGAYGNLISITQRN